VTVKLPGYVELEKGIGCIPDGIIDPDGLLEIKCPQWKSHVDYVINGPDKKYLLQMQFQMMVTGAEWCDFMTYHPDMPDHLKAKVYRIYRDKDTIDEILERIQDFKALIASYEVKLAGR